MNAEGTQRKRNPRCKMKYEYLIKMRPKRLTVNPRWKAKTNIQCIYNHLAKCTIILRISKAPLQSSIQNKTPPPPPPKPQQQQPRTAYKLKISMETVHMKSKHQERRPALVLITLLPAQEPLQISCTGASAPN